MRTGGKRRVPDYRFGIRMRMMGVSIEDSVLQKVTKTTLAQPIVIACRQVTAQLINRDLQNEPRSFLG